MAQFEASIQIACPRETAFEFLSRPSNYAEISPSQMGFTLVEGPDVMIVGSRIEFQLQAMGLTQRVIHEVVHWKHPHQITLEQIRGPMRKWVHDHLLVGEGEDVVITDRIEFDPPGGMLGFVATEARILAALNSGIAERHLALKQRLESLPS
jgi:ligand-binding SRPBCC domain-containing protein